MNATAVVLAAAALVVAGWQWRGQWRARPAVPGPLAVATWTVVGPSTRTTIALAVAAGMIGAEWGAARLVEEIAWLAGVTGLDAAAWAPAGADVVFAAAVAAGVADVAVLGLYRWSRIAPALRHSLIGLVLPAVLVAGLPLLTQTTADAVAAIGQVPAPAACAPPDMAGDAVAGYGPEQLAHAATIVQVGREMGVPERGQVIAVATAMQESTLRNLNHGDRDSLGLFQQRPSQGWGTPAQVRDPRYAARKFYDGLAGVRGWSDLPLWQSAQAVQRSAYPTAYSKHETAAAQVLGAVAGTTCNTETRS